MPAPKRPPGGWSAVVDSQLGGLVVPPVFIDSDPAIANDNLLPCQQPWRWALDPRAAAWRRLCCAVLDGAIFDSRRRDRRRSDALAWFAAPDAAITVNLRVVRGARTRYTADSGVGNPHVAGVARAVIAE